MRLVYARFLADAVFFHHLDMETLNLNECIKSLISKFLKFSEIDLRVKHA